MPRSRTPAEGEPFWRCTNCGTPNPRVAYLTLCIGCGRPRPAQPDSARVATFSETTLTASAWERPRSLVAMGLSVVSLFYAVLVLSVLVFLWTLGDRWWPATVVLFAPRWLWLVPLPVLALATLGARGVRGRNWAIQGATALVVVGPLMGLHVPFTRLLDGRPSGTTLRIMTLNRHKFHTDPERLSTLVERERIDIVCFQEAGAGIPLDPVFLWGWEHNADHTLFSRFPIVAMMEDSSDDYWPEYDFWVVRHRRVIVRLPDGQDVVVASAHMPTPRTAVRFALNGEGDRASRYSDWRWRQLGELAQVLAKTRDLPTLVGGDLNTPGDSPLIGLLRSDFQLAFNRAGWGYGYTRPAWLPWVGIDHVLVSPHFTVTHCWVGPDVGSDHRPMVAEVVLPIRP